MVGDEGARAARPKGDHPMPVYLLRAKRRGRAPTYAAHRGARTTDADRAMRFASAEEAENAATRRRFATDDGHGWNVVRQPEGAR